MLVGSHLNLEKIFVTTGHTEVFSCLAFLKISFNTSINRFKDQILALTEKCGQIYENLRFQTNTLVDLVIIGCNSLIGPKIT